jgi:RimJ/RimL family protein N-acetyltransferase
MDTVAALPEVLPAGLVELRRCRVDDLDALMTAIESSHADLARWLPWADPMPTVEDERAFVENLEAVFTTDDEWGYFLIERHSGELVGGAGLHPRGPGIAEIGYWVRSDRTRKGYATAAARALTEAAFQHLPEVQRVIIRMDQANIASAAVPRKLGYRLEGEETGREIVTSGHTGKGWIWVRTRPES